MSGDPELVDTLSGSEPLSAHLNVADRTLLAFAIRLTRNPSRIAAVDIEELRRAGFEDRAIHDACQVVAYFAYVNRIADGLGVELESDS